MGNGVMRDEPRAEKLLMQARKTLIEDLLPNLPEGRRYEALMVASAMAMAVRELAAEDRSAEDTVELAKLADSIESLTTEIRAGHRDADGEVYGYLYRDAAARLAISNPKLLVEDT